MQKLAVNSSCILKAFTGVNNAVSIDAVAVPTLPIWWEQSAAKPAHRAASTVVHTMHDYKSN